MGTNRNFFDISFQKRNTMKKDKRHEIKTFLIMRFFEMWNCPRKKVWNEKKLWILWIEKTEKYYIIRNVEKRVESLRRNLKYKS